MTLEIPGYKILRTLGKGGMATVYLAVQEVFEREVALKVMSRSLADDPNFSQRFFREAKIVSQLVHPNIVTVHDVGVHEDSCYLSMEYIDGQDFRYVCGSMTVREKIRAIRDIAKALDYAGSKGYVHRDIKPENIMFHTSDGRAVLMDFGIARAAESDTMVTQEGTAIGTPHYMSPEQAKGKSVDTRSDIYSLGVVFYYIFAGRVPYDAESAVAVGIKHITEPVPLLPEDYDALQPIVDNMMAKDANDRYQSAQELIEDLDRIDVDSLAHSVEFSRNSLIPPSTDTISEQLTQNYQRDEAQHVSLTTYDSFIAENELKDGVPILSWMISGIFVLAVVGGFMYFKHPEIVMPYVNQITQIIGLEKPASSNEVLDSELSEPLQPLMPGDSFSGDVFENLNALKQQYSTDKTKLAALAAAHREVIAEDSSLENQANYERFRHAEIEALKLLADTTGTSEALNQKIALYQQAFPELSKDTINDIRALAKKRKKVLSLVLEAEAYLKQNNLTQPTNRNALYFYEKALEIEPNNSQAIQGKNDIAQKIALLAQKQLDDQNYDDALKMAKKSLSIDENNQTAKRVQEAVEAALASNAA